MSRSEEEQHNQSEQEEEEEEQKKNNTTGSFLLHVERAVRLEKSIFYPTHVFLFSLRHRASFLSLSRRL